jgi:hypothetical protein
MTDAAIFRQKQRTIMDELISSVMNEFQDINATYEFRVQIRGWDRYVRVYKHGRTMDFKFLGSGDIELEVTIDEYHKIVKLGSLKDTNSSKFDELWKHATDYFNTMVDMYFHNPQDLIEYVDSNF